MQDGVQGVLDLLAEREFETIWEAAENAPCTPASVARWPQPRGLSPDETWRLMSAIRRKTAIAQAPFPWEPRQITRWYYLTRSMRADEAVIEERCRRGGVLDTMVRSRDSAQFVAAGHVDSALAAIREDGAQLSAATARQIAFGARRPRQPEELVLAGCHRVIQSLGDLSGVECTPALIRQLNVEICHGAAQTRRSRPPVSVTGYVTPASSPDQALQSVSEIVNMADRPQTVHPIARVVAIRVLFDACHPFGSWNGATAVVIGRLLLVRSHMPALGYVPYTTLLRDWHDGRIAPPQVPVSEREAILPYGDEMDHTLWMATVLRLIRQELESTQASFQRISSAETELIDIIGQNVRLNHRQRAVLFAALADHNTTFRIESHGRIHRVAYSTAYTDLMSLEHMEYLRSSKQSRALVFSPNPKLRRLLRQAVPARE